MPKVAGLGHVGLFVKDMPKMIDFYTNFLGLTLTDRGPDDRFAPGRRDSGPQFLEKQTTHESVAACPATATQPRPEPLARRREAAP